MPHEAEYFDLRCPGCGWCELCGPEGMTRWLLKARKLRPHGEPDLEVLVEVFRAMAPRLACPECGKTGLVAGPSKEDIDWPAARHCASCQKLISAERLSAVPGATLCAACQKTEEQGGSTGEVEYCPGCGAAMVLRPSKTAGITRYVLVCTGQPPCRLRR